MKSFQIIILYLFIALFSSCEQKSKLPIDKRLIQAVATTGMVADAVRNVGGERVKVAALMGPGVDPHLYKASEGDVIRIAEADIVFYSGLHLEAKLAEVFEKIGKYRPTAGIADKLPRERLLEHSVQKGFFDPHVWFDVSLWKETLSVIADVLSRLDPGSKEYYAKRSVDYYQQLTLLHEKIKEEIKKIPADKRVLITAHDAFGYFGKAYGFEVIGIQGISTAAEAGVLDITRLADLIARRKIPAIFVETSVSPKSILALREAVLSRGFNLVLGGSLYSDALGSPGGPAEDYPGMVRVNVSTIINALSSQSTGEK